MGNRLLESQDVPLQTSLLVLIITSYLFGDISCKSRIRRQREPTTSLARTRSSSLLREVGRTSLIDAGEEPMDALSRRAYDEMRTLRCGYLPQDERDLRATTTAAAGWRRSGVHCVSGWREGVPRSPGVPSGRRRTRPWTRPPSRSAQCSLGRWVCVDKCGWSVCSEHHGSCEDNYMRRLLASQPQRRETRLPHAICSAMFYNYLRKLLLSPKRLWW